MLLAAGGMFLLTRLGADSTYLVDILPALVPLGLGMGLIFAPSMSAATAGVANSDAGVASAMVNTTQQVGGAIGTALRTRRDGPTPLPVPALEPGQLEACCQTWQPHG